MFGEKETYKYLQILKVDTIKQRWKKNVKRVPEKNEKTSVICSRNLIKGINTWAVPLVRHSGPFLKWTKEKQTNGPENSWLDYVETKLKQLIT